MLQFVLCVFWLQASHLFLLRSSNDYSSKGRVWFFPPSASKVVGPVHSASVPTKVLRSGQKLTPISHTIFDTFFSSSQDPSFGKNISSNWISGGNLRCWEKAQTSLVLCVVRLKQRILRKNISQVNNCVTCPIFCYANVYLPNILQSSNYIV